MTRLSHSPVETLENPELRCYLEQAANWQRVFRSGVTEHAIEQLCRVHVSRAIDRR